MAEMATTSHPTGNSRSPVTNELWPTTLGRLRDQFERISLDDPNLFARLIEEPILRLTPEKERIPKLPPHLTHGTSRTFFSSNGSYRNPRQLFTSEGMPEVGENLFYSGDGRPMLFKTGKPIAMDPGASRSLEVWGRTETWRRFEGVAEQAGTCVNGIPATPLKAIIANESLMAINPTIRWFWILFDLALNCGPGSPFQIKRCTLADIPRFQLPATISVEEVDALVRQGWIPPVTSPPFWFATLPNLPAASAWAIDVLLDLSKMNGKPATPGTDRAEPPKAPKQRGRPRGDKYSSVIRRMIENGDVYRLNRSWKQLLARYKKELPAKWTPGTLRSRVTREEARQGRAQ